MVSVEHLHGLWVAAKLADAMPPERDIQIRQAAMEQLRGIQQRYEDLIPVQALRAGFQFHGERVSYGSFYSGIFRPSQMRGPAALALVTAPPKSGQPPPYEDTFDEQTGRFTYHFRDAGSQSPGALRQAEADNAAMLAAHELAVPLIYFRGIAPSQYSVVAPVFITAVDHARREVEFEAALPLADTTEAGLVSPEDTRRYATREALYRLHQHRFRAAVLRAYSSRCAVCSLREAALLQAAHIIDDHDPRGAATVVNGIALCAIHHLAYDRNLMGIDPGGVVHIATRLLNEVDGPMLLNGLQGFHGHALLQPRRAADKPDPKRLEIRYSQFLETAS